jgi:prepilin-type N-terminal cleavage/methylation domain-containing protein
MRALGLSSRFHASGRPVRASLAFTLIEVMVVVSILGIVLAVGIPAWSRGASAAPMIQTIREIREVCSFARARAIFSGTRTQVIFRPNERTFAVSGGAGTTQVSGRTKGSGTSGVFHESLSLEMLDVNLMEFKDQPLAVVNFYPNGTSDELTIILRSDENVWRKVTLEVTTALTTVGSVQ